MMIENKMRQEDRDIIFLYQIVVRCELSPIYTRPHILYVNVGKAAPLAKSLERQL